jgi:hypothetical protein
MTGPFIDVRDGVRVLTRAGYARAIEMYFHDSVAEVAKSVRALDAAAFGAVALARFDKAAPKYGPLDLDGRDWIQNGHEEDVDGVAYRIIRRVKDFGV